MARIRTIKPEFWTSEQVVECSPIARLLFVGLWNFSDDGGRHPASVKRVKMEIFPGDDFTHADIGEWLAELLHNGLIQAYTVDNQQFWQITGWHHQRIDKPTFKHPEPVKFDDHSTSPPIVLAERSPPEGKGRESKGKDLKNADPLPSVADGGHVSNSWDIARQWLGGALLGKSLKQYGDDRVRRCLAETVAKNPADPKSYLLACLKGKKHETHQNGNGKLSAVDRVRERNRRKAIERGEIEPDPSGEVIDGQYSVI